MEVAPPIHVARMKASPVQPITVPYLCHALVDKRGILDISARDEPKGICCRGGSLANCPCVRSSAAFFLAPNSLA